MDTFKSIFKGYDSLAEAQVSASKRKTIKRLIFIAVSAFVLVAMVIAIAIAVGVSQENNSKPSSTPELTPAASLKSVCSVTRYYHTYYTYGHIKHI